MYFEIRNSKISTRLEELGTRRTDFWNGMEVCVVYEPVVLLLRENLVYLARPAKQMKKLNY